MKIVPMNYTFKIPSEIAVCPYCNSKLFANCIAWAESDDGWIAEQLEIDCESEPDIDTNDWEEWITSHTYMPFVYELPVDNKIEKWINQNFRFEVE